MDTVELLKLLKAKVSGTISAMDTLRLSKIVEDLEIGHIEVVPDYTDIPEASEAPIRKAYFVKSSGILVWKKENSEWSTTGGSDITANAIWTWGTNNNYNSYGYNYYHTSPGEIVTPSEISWKEIASGPTHGIALAGGHLIGWGESRAGIGGSAFGRTPHKFTDITDWKTISIGDGFSMGIRRNQSLWAWGSNNNGQLGNNTNYTNYSPTSLVGNWSSVSCGFHHASGIQDDGTLWAWGLNNEGQLGEGTTIDRSSPVSVVGGFTDWDKVTCGYAHSIALRENGTLWGFGRNETEIVKTLYARGCVGDGTDESRSSPVSVVGGFTDWSGVSSHTHHEFTIGLRENGTLWGWGYGYGTIGDGTNHSRSSPVSVVGGFTDWSNFVGGDQATFGIRDNGTLWAWGRNTQGQLGDSTTTHRSSPVSVVGGFTDWVSLPKHVGKSVHVLKARQAYVYAP